MKKLFLILIATLVFSPAKADDKALIATVYNVIIDKNITPVVAESLALSGLQAIKGVDKDFLFSDGTDKVYLYYKGKRAGLWKRPTDKKDVEGWADVTANVVKAATKSSPIADERDFEIVDKILASAVRSLNNHSRYISGIEDEDTADNKKTRYFSERGYKDILYLRVGGFNDDTKDNIVASLNENPNIKGLILDLRGNAGGQINVAIEVAKLFIDQGIIISVKGREGTPVKFYNASGSEIFGKPMVVLIDGETASAAEVLAAALQEQAGAKLVGTQTYGKGSVQEVYSFENDGKLSLTTAYFHTPSGKKIDAAGLMPDYCTFKVVETIRKELKDYATLQCARQGREDVNTDLEVAVEVLKNEF